MTPDDLRARLPIIADEDPGPTGHVLLERIEKDGGTITHSVDPEELAARFADVDWTDRAALVAADHRPARVDRVNRRLHLSKADGTFSEEVPATNPDDVVEEEVDLGYADHLDRWHREGRFAR